MAPSVASSSSSTSAPPPKQKVLTSKGKGKTAAQPGGNWAALKAKISPAAGGSSNTHAKKRKWKESMSSVAEFAGRERALLADGRSAPGPDTETSFKRGRVSGSDATASTSASSSGANIPANVAAGASLSPKVVELRTMVLGAADFVGTKAEPGRYLAIDCEMVGVGPEGAESSLARVSIVNYHGSVVLDTFVKQLEKVVDYRTWVSGVASGDLIGAPSLIEVQRMVADLIKDKILIGHAIKNDFDALLLSHPRALTRDTQTCPGLRKAGGGSRTPGLKKLALIELGVEIQSGRHSSVIDARATMALYRLHKDEWEPTFARLKAGPKHKKGEVFPGGGVRGQSSGLGLVVRSKGGKDEGSAGGKRERVPSSAGSGSGSNWWDDA